MTESDIKQVIEEWDMILRPNAAFIHPDYADEIKSAYPEIEKKFFVVYTESVEKGKVIVIKRNDLKTFEKGLWE